MVYFSFYINDFLSGTCNFSRLQRWLYFDLLCLYYDTERPIPLDLEPVFTIIGAQSDEEKNAAMGVLKLKFERTENGYKNARCEKQIKEYYDFIEKQRESGRKGGKKTQAKKRTKTKTSEQSPSDPKAPLEHRLSDPKANQYSVISNQYKNQNLVPLESVGFNNSSDPKAPLEHRLSDPINLFEKFQMCEDWQPNPEIFAGVCSRNGFDANQITPEILASFTTYWAGERKQFTAAQWVQKLIDAARRSIATAPRNTEAQSAYEIFKSGLDGYEFADDAGEPTP